MCRVIHDDGRVLDRLFSSLGAFSRAFALATPGGAAREDDGVMAAVVPAMPDRSVVNCVVYDDAPALKARLGSVAATYDEAGIEAWTVWVPAADGEAIAAAHAEAFGETRPVSTMVEVSGFLDPRWKVEIEAEAQL